MFGRGRQNNMCGFRGILDHLQGRAGRDVDPDLGKCRMRVALQFGFVIGIRPGTGDGIGDSHDFFLALVARS